MAIDYVVTARCSPQQKLGVAALVNAHRTRIFARTILAQSRADGDDRDPAEITIQMTTRRPEGDRAGAAVTLADLAKQSAVLDTVSCAGCPAGYAREFACHGRIRYPIPETAEAWLLARLPNNLATTAGVMLIRALTDFGWDGEPVARMRAAGDTFFESRIPLGLRWVGETGATSELSSDQLFQMMFMVGNLNPAHAKMLLLFTGLVPHDTPIADLMSAERVTELLAAIELPPHPDAEIEQLASFLRALAVAVRLDSEVAIDS